ncbi:phospholipase [Sphaerisporangium corydalis]|uniref:Phospholipase n=1 Tax=Sphaerisporangium corydalis TaxID=1441875 RepID=A0ABV9EKA4_9ACTN|nr:phospholipase [Sphaerisporangium corydalis]
MRTRNAIASLSVAFAAATATLATALPAYADLSAVELQTKTDQYIFTDSIGTFLQERAAQPYATQIDWSSDGCSWAPDKPQGFDFLPSCQRHDFGYRNYKRQSRFNEDNRGQIDINFKDDMYDVCRKYSGTQAYKGVICRGIADTYYATVRNLGGT